MKAGDLVVVKNGYKLSPSPKKGDIGMIIKLVEENHFIVYLANKFISLWKIKNIDLEVINNE